MGEANIDHGFGGLTSNRIHRRGGCDSGDSKNQYLRLSWVEPQWQLQISGGGEDEYVLWIMLQVQCSKGVIEDPEDQADMEGRSRDLTASRSYRLVNA